MILTNDYLAVTLKGITFRSSKVPGLAQNWILDATALNGWYDGVGARRQSTQRALGDGDFADVATMASRVVTLTGMAVADNAQDLHDMRDQFIGLLSDGQYTEMKVENSFGTRHTTVGQENTPQWVQHTDTIATYKLDMFQPDPRVYGGQRLISIYGSPSASGGLLYSTAASATRTNLATNPSFEATSGTVNVRTNLALDPNATATANWGVMGSGGQSVSVDSTLAHSGTTSIKSTCTSAGVVGLACNVSNPGFTTGDTVVWSVWVYPSATTSIQPYWERINNTYEGGGSPAVTCPAGTWTQVTGSVTFASGQANAGDVFHFGVLAQSGVAVGVTINADQIIVERAATLGPYFDGSTTPTVLRTNLCTNPSFETGTTGWTPDTGNPTLASDGTRAVYGSKSLQAVGTGSTDVAVRYLSSSLAASATYTFSYYVYSPNSCTSYVDIVTAGTTLSQQGSTSVQAGMWTRISTTFTTPASGTVSFYLHNKNLPSGTNTVWFDAVLLEQSSSVGTYFDGSMSTGGGYAYSWSGAANASTSLASDPDFTYAWSGTANASTSYQQAPGLGGVSDVPSLAMAYQSSVWSNSRGHSVRITPVSSSADSFAELGGMGITLNPSTTYVISGTVHLPAALTGTLAGTALGFRVNWGSELTFTYLQTATNAPGSYRVAAKFTTPASGSMNFIRIYNGASAGNGDVWWDDLLIEQASTAGPYFDGTTVAAGSTHAWAGPADASTSTETASAQQYLSYSLDYTTGVSQQGQTLSNAGNVDAWPVFTVVGNFYGGFTITDNLGHNITYSGDASMLAPVVIDTSTGVATQNGQDRTTYLTSRQWFPVPAGTSLRPSFKPVNGATGWCDIIYRDTWI